MECCICHGEIDIHYHPETGEAVWDQGHNALPVVDGRCCDDCNQEHVLPRRMERIERPVLH